MKNKSLWREFVLPKFSKLTRSAQYDTVVIGGGLTGLTTAYLLKQQGQRVCVLERGRIGGVDTAATTAPPA